MLQSDILSQFILAKHEHEDVISLMSRAHHVGSDDTLQFEHDLLSGHEAGVRPAGEGLLSCTGCSIHLILTRATGLKSTSAYSNMAGPPV